MLSQFITWLKFNYSKLLVGIFCLALGTGVGLAINTTGKEYIQTINTPHKLKILEFQLKKPKSFNQTRVIEVMLDIKSQSTNKICDRINQHVLIDMDDRNNIYSLNTSLAGGNYSTTSNNPRIHIVVPNTVPHGHYKYTIRTLYLCNVSFAGLITYHLETDPIDVFLN